MKQMLFETRNKAEDLLKQALDIWRQSDQADYLEGIEKDPVFSLLMMALAYQSNELDSELERLKQDVLEDFSRMLVPYEMAHATPATAIVQTSLMDEVPEMTLGENSWFRLTDKDSFLPLLQTRVLNAKVKSVTRLDGRRWKVTLGFRHPVTDLSKFAFVIKGLPFRDLSISIKGRALPLVKPWDYSELPFAPYFAPDSLCYNYGQMFNPSNLPMDLFARQNIRLFCIRKHNPQDFIAAEAENLDLVFEFYGIPENFIFDKDAIFLNPVILVNVQLQEAALSAATPMVRLSGGQFLHLVRPLENQIFNHTELEVRGVAGDRFNQGSLMKLVNSIITKYRSDFYAFQSLKGTVTDNAVHQMENALSKLQEQGMADTLSNITGVYLMPRSASISKDFSLNVKYLTTSGAAINAILGQVEDLSAPSGFLPGVKSIAVPIPGTDEIQDKASLDQIMRYYMVTGDRVVTPADIKFFCQKELMLRYGIGNNLVKDISVHRTLQQDSKGCGYEIAVQITLLGNSFVKRSLTEQLPVAEILLQKMMEVRSTNIYPIRVNINIEEQQ